MDQEQAIARILMGESMPALAAAYREELLRDCGLMPEEAGRETFRKDTADFMQKLCRRLGDRHAGDRRICAALQEWVRGVSDYAAFDALLSSFDFEGKRNVIDRGRQLFPGPLTAHWQE